MKKNKTGAIVKYCVAALSLLFGVVLLVAGKSFAGPVFIITPCVVLLPLDRVFGKNPIIKWLRIGLIAFFCILAVLNIYNTDIPPDAAYTGIKFIDQLMNIFKRFASIVFGG